MEAILRVRHRIRSSPGFQASRPVQCCVLHSSRESWAVDIDHLSRLASIDFLQFSSYYSCATGINRLTYIHTYTYVLIDRAIACEHQPYLGVFWRQSPVASTMYRRHGPSYYTNLPCSGVLLGGQMAFCDSPSYSTRSPRHGGILDPSGVTPVQITTQFHMPDTCILICIRCTCETHK